MRIPPYANKHVFVVRPEAALGGCLHACSRVIWFPLVTPWIPFGFPWKRYVVQKCFRFGPRLILGGAYMLVRGHACSRKGVEQVPVEELYPHDLGGEDRQQLSQLQGACDVLAEDTACLLAATMAGMMRDPC